MRWIKLSKAYFVLRREETLQKWQEILIGQHPALIASTKEEYGFLTKSLIQKRNQNCFCTEMEVGEPKEFEVQTSGAGGRGNLEVEVTGPSRQPVDTKEKDSARGKKIDFVPEEEGNCWLRFFLSQYCMLNCC